MDIIQAKEIIISLADGVDPVTGEIFDEDSPYQHPSVIRALYTAIEGIEKIEKQKNREKTIPTNTGKSWSTEEDQKLIEGYHGMKTIKELTLIHERTHGAIKSRLARLGILQQ